ncbi:isoaspartyl peptidase/L-asparaginase family protein [Galbibacter mesophilus]|uniref:isoaspartyl peptidase/L-asparaginase family protein n=1 Tax=Galbibacter mesophilus TaxID=379069 RepID=UPI00191F8EDA|nr:isoaspartyl peptidase/L-asparaginase [Galbibacter mesophilus]MCM5661438.1 isoaspartyl peptidase/L-asparaginase [Galbibacter mesophilus]
MSKKQKFSLCIHGGAGVISKEELSDKEKKAIVKDLKKSLTAGEKILEKGGSAVDAVCAAVEALENSAYFNAGKGSVYARSGKHFLEASVMEGATLQAGAVANSERVKNPVLFAKELLKNKDVVMMSGTNADVFAEKLGCEMVENQYFDNDFRKKQWEQAKELSEDAIFLDHSNLKMGTVGAVAIDSDGNVASATSTGGMTNKLDGRVGDTAIIGCGTYANNKTCAVSCTGIGEFFIRATVASTVSNLMEYGQLSLEEASKIAIHEHQGKMGGEGGLIAVDKNGGFTMPYNSGGMYRGFVTDSDKKVFIWDDEE